jgi:hypothetical protein
MYEVKVDYIGKEEDTLICDSKPGLDVESGFIFLNCGKGQSLTLNIDDVVKISIKYPLPDKVPAFKWAADIHYTTDNEDVELLFSSSEIHVDVEESGELSPSIITVKEGDNIIRVINSVCLRSVKVNTYSEKYAVSDCDDCPNKSNDCCSKEAK